MLGDGEDEKRAIRPDLTSSVFIDFAGAKVIGRWISSDAGS
jgi:hypothetical protein